MCWQRLISYPATAMSEYVHLLCKCTHHRVLSEWELFYQENDPRYVFGSQHLIVSQLFWNTIQ